jgi:hypothetical protein
MAQSLVEANLLRIDHWWSSRRGRAADTASDPLPSTLRHADLRYAPFNRGGRLHVHWSSQGKDVHCSSQFVGADNLLVTAAHCVR